MNSIKTALEGAYEASLALTTSKGVDRSRGLLLMAQAIQSALDEILEANTLDLEISRDMAVPELILEWLKLTPERLKITIRILERLGELSDPIGSVRYAPYPLEEGQTHFQMMPLGVVAFIYEALPELGIIAAGLALKTGNSIILRGGSEANHSNTIIAQVLATALEKSNLPPGCLTVLPCEQGSDIRDLVVQDQYLNLVIPYGRSSLVQKVTEAATVPVLKSAIGNCYLYWSIGNLELARWLIMDSHASEPDPVNAIEKVLVTPGQKSNSLMRMFTTLKEKGFILRGDAQLVDEFPGQLSLAKESEWGKAYLQKIVAFKVVKDLDSAITWINQYSSGHADCIVTNSYQETYQFTLGIDSALVYVNTSPRFARNPKQGSSVFLGVSNQKGHRRGLISMETLTSFKQVVKGRGF